MIKILIVDDNQQITEILKQYAIREGYDVAIAKDGQAALDLFVAYEPDLILLDVMMPIIDGFEVCRTIRRQSQVPIIMITARSEDFDKIMGLDTGADDYIVKPFSSAEVMARIRALLRRVVMADAQSQIVKVDNLIIDASNYSVIIDSINLKLTKKEFEMLWLFCNHPQRVFSREQLLEKIWGFDYYGETRTVDTHIKRLRAKLDAYEHPNWNLITIWGVGYKFEVNNDV